MDDGRVVHVLGISGSLRSASSNSALVRAAVRVTPIGVELSIYRELADIPPFNPDLDTEVVPAAVSRFRAALQASDAILISSPEYAHGVSGVLKNALDWVVSSGELIDKPIAVINVSARATHAHASLCEILTTMSGRLIGDASITIPVTGTALDAEARLSEPRLSTSLRSAIEVLADATRANRKGQLSMARDVLIRPARSDEHTMLESLQRRASLSNPGDRDALLANPDAIALPVEQIAAGCVFVAERDGVVAGFAAVMARPDGGAELDALFVEPHLWRRGIGRRLVDHVIEAARATAASFLHVIGNPHAEGFYVACGFHVIGTVDTRFGVGLAMRRPL